MSLLISDLLWHIDVDLCGGVEKTIHDEETSDVDLAESMTDLKVRCCAIRVETELIPHRISSRLNTPRSDRVTRARSKI